MTTPRSRCGHELYRDQKGFYCPRPGHRFPWQPRGDGRCAMDEATAENTAHKDALAAAWEVGWIEVDGEGNMTLTEKGQHHVAKHMTETPAEPCDCFPSGVSR